MISTVMSTTPMIAAYVILTVMVIVMIALYIGIVI